MVFSQLIFCSFSRNAIRSLSCRNGFLRCPAMPEPSESLLLTLVPWTISADAMAARPLCLVSRPICLFRPEWSATDLVNMNISTATNTFFHISSGCFVWWFSIQIEKEYRVVGDYLLYYSSLCVCVCVFGVVCCRWYCCCCFAAIGR